MTEHRIEQNTLWTAMAFYMFNQTNISTAAWLITDDLFVNKFVDEFLKKCIGLWLIKKAFPHCIWLDLLSTVLLLSAGQRCFGDF